MTSYASKKSAVRAARKALGQDAIEGIDFTVHENEDSTFGWAQDTSEDTSPDQSQDQSPDQSPDQSQDTSPDTSEDMPALPSSLRRDPVEDEAARQAAAMKRSDRFVMPEPAQKKKRGKGGQSARIRTLSEFEGSWTEKFAPSRQNAPREGTQNRKVYDLMSRPYGATKAEIDATGWKYANYFSFAVQFAIQYGMDALEAPDPKRSGVQRYYLLPEGTADAQAAAIRAYERGAPVPEDGGLAANEKGAVVDGGDKAPADNEPAASDVETAA